MVIETTKDEDITPGLTEEIEKERNEKTAFLNEEIESKGK